MLLEDTRQQAVNAIPALQANLPQPRESVTKAVPLEVLLIGCVQTANKLEASYVFNYHIPKLIDFLGVVAAKPNVA